MIEEAVRLHRDGRLGEAKAVYESILDAEPEHVDALHLLGVIAYQEGRHQEAVDLISRSLASAPSNHHALNHLGEAFRAMGSLDEASTCFERALELKDDYYPAYNNLGNVYQMWGRFDRAIACFQKSLSINPEYAEAHTNLGNIFLESANYDSALACYKRALEIRPEFPDALVNLGNLYKILRRFDEAIPLYEKTVELRPKFTLGHLALARAYQGIGEREKAIACFRQALALTPENGEARWGLVLSELAMVNEDENAVEDYRDAFARGLDELERWFDGSRTDDGYAAVGTQQPFYLAYHEENNRDLLSRYGTLCNRLARHWQSAHNLAPGKRARGSRIRIGIASAYFYNHSVWHAFLKGWCGQLDDRRFELHLFSLGAIRDAETQIAQDRATQFEEGSKHPEQWAKTILAHSPDVLLYPEIGMDPLTAKLANLRLAPVQMTTWGHPETSGLPTVDYYLSGADFEPRDAQENYSEKLVLLPNLSAYYEPLETLVEDIELQTLGIDPGKPVLICPGTPFKYSPRHDSIYIEIARRLGRCQFVFFKYPVANLSRRFMQRLEAAFRRAGLDVRSFVIELPWLSKAHFNSLMRQADVYLDTVGFSGFNTAIQAIECGLPVVSRDGRFLRGRLASGILRRLGMTELIAASDDGYVELTARLAQDPDYRHDLRARIEQSRHVLFQDIAPVRSLEKFFARVVAS